MASNLPGAIDNLSAARSPRKVQELEQTLDQVQRLVVGPTQYDVMGHASYDPIAATNTTAIQGTIDLARGTNGGGIVNFPERGNYKTATTIEHKSNVTLVGSLGTIVPSSGIFKNGSQLLWTGATGGVVLRMNGTNSARVDGIGIDGGAIANVVGIHLTSANAPASQNNSIERFAIQRCGSGSDSGIGIRVADGVTNNWQVDKTKIGQGWIYATATGAKIESDNALDGTVWGPMHIDAYQTAVDLVACGEMTFDSWVFGGYTGFSARTVTVSTTSGSKVVTVTTGTMTQADVGAQISGTGIPTYAIITKVVSGTVVHIHRAATATATGVTLTVTPGGVDFKLSNRWNPITIRNSQNEGFGGVSLLVPSTAGATYNSPITLGPSNVFTRPVILNQICKFVSHGNNYAQPFVLGADYISGVSEDGWVDLGLGAGRPNFVRSDGILYGQVFAPISIASGEGFGPLQCDLGALDDAIRILFDGLRLGVSGKKLGFYGTAPAAKPTGVAVTAAGVHAALVTLGLISA